LATLRQENAEAFRAAVEGEFEKLPYTDFVCCCLGRDGAVRRNLIAMIEDSSFDALCLGMIAVNTLTMAMFDPADRECLTDRCKASN